ncbi:MAG TPA: hypothetical protein VGD69_20510 [Herpetosiphonaceae bacterium]
MHGIQGIARVKAPLSVLIVISFIAAAIAVAPALAAPGPTFIDPTAKVINAANIQLGELVYVGPFAQLKANKNVASSIVIGDESNVQDSATVDATFGRVVIGDQVIIAHGGTVKSGSQLGIQGSCPVDPALQTAPEHCPSFVSFNAEVDGAIIEKDAMVQALSRVGPGVRIPSGKKTRFGVNITTQAEVSSKTEPVVQADREFMNGVIHVNVEFAKGYTALASNPSHVRGINYDPGNTAFNPTPDLPTLGANHVPTQDPKFRNRIIGRVHLADDKATLGQVMGAQISIRADEGEAWEVGTIAAMGNHTTFHALEHTHLDLGNVGVYGERSIVHGGATDYNGDADTADPDEHDTVTGENFVLGTGSVFFRSHAGDNVKIGARSLVAGSSLDSNSAIPSYKVIVGGQVYGDVEW